MEHELIKTLERIVSALQGYSKWIGATSQERELINAIKLTVERAREAIDKAATQPPPDGAA